jgi:hypothetical protein
MRPPRALPAAHFDRNESYAYFGDRTLAWSEWERRRLGEGASLESLKSKAHLMVDAPTRKNLTPFHGADRMEALQFLIEIP